MLDASNAKRVIVVGGGTAGWFAALEMRHCFPADVEIMVIESAQIGIIGAGEGSIPNFGLALKRYGIDQQAFMAATHSTYKLGVCFDGWRSGAVDDRYHHLFSTRRNNIGLQEWYARGFYPLSAKLLADGWGLDQFPDARRLIDAEASQSTVAAHLAATPKDVFAYHFDARRLAAYLAEFAQDRGIKRVDTVVRDAVCDEGGHVRQLHTDAGIFKADFFVDASGFRRVLASGALGIGWESFEKYLILDAALPFFQPLAGEKPPLTTHSKAMRNGWMWTIPTQGRLGCGYVYSSAHCTESQAIGELTALLGKEVEPIARLKFSPGRLNECLRGNVLAVGLASGFVEPLEATSIAQTLDQLSFFGNLVLENQGCIPDQVVRRFNAEVIAAWDGILDFLILHYDTRRADTPFWNDIGKLPKTSSYLQLKEAFARRTPRHSDLVPFQMGGTSIFGIPSWETVASSMGLISAETCQRQLQWLDPLAQASLDAFAKSLH